jgi:uncharacterized protein YoxC
MNYLDILAKMGILIGVLVGILKLVTVVVKWWEEKIQAREQAARRAQEIDQKLKGMQAQINHLKEENQQLSKDAEKQYDRLSREVDEVKRDIGQLVRDMLFKTK